MRTDNVLLIICLVVAGALAINLGLVFILSRSRLEQPYHIIRETLRSARNPWRQENEQLSELRKRILEFEKREDQNDPE
ncbi:MAG: hypothetical protein GTO18_18665 [Anaerolineales bacterium]|nr:hypothetical protein [Anaerolineales bacterium]